MFLTFLKLGGRFNLLFNLLCLSLYYCMFVLLCTSKIKYRMKTYLGIFRMNIKWYIPTLRCWYATSDFRFVPQHIHHEKSWLLVICMEIFYEVFWPFNQLPEQESNLCTNSKKSEVVMGKKKGCAWVIMDNYHWDLIEKSKLCMVC